MISKPTENRLNFVARNGNPKSEIVAKIARIVRREGLDYTEWKYVCRRVREKCELRPPKKPVKLPRVLHPNEFRRFYQVVDRAENAQHSLLLRLLFYTAVRVSELCEIHVADVNLEEFKVRITQGKGHKDRYVLFGKTFGVALRAHISGHPKNRWLFQSRLNGPYSSRRVQQIVKLYAEKAGVSCTPHTFRHQAITWLTRNSELADAELQLITGHARRETLARYQHIALDKQLSGRYQEAMKAIEF